MQPNNLKFFQKITTTVYYSFTVQVQFQV